MDPTVEDLIVLVESLSLRVKAIEKALPNLDGFYVETEDGSQQGQIVYQPTQEGA